MRLGGPNSCPVNACAKFFSHNMERERDCLGSDVIRLTVAAEDRLGKLIIGLVNSDKQLELMQ